MLLSVKSVEGKAASEKFVKNGFYFSKPFQVRNDIWKKESNSTIYKNMEIKYEKVLYISYEDIKKIFF